MSKKKQFNDFGGLVYSTDPHFTPIPEEEEVETLAPEQQVLRIRYERAGRGGKEATIISGFVGTEEDLKELATRLKQSLGCGGSAKEGLIILQGDKRNTLLPLLQKWRYKNSK